MKKSKKFICVWLLLIFTFGIITSPAMAKEDIKVILNGTKLSFDVPPQTINDHTVVPVRILFETLGMDVYWIDAPYTEPMILAVKNEIKILMAIDQNELIKYIGNDFNQFIDDLDHVQPIVLDVAPQLVDGRTLVPLRAISEALGVDVAWEESSRTVVLTCNEEFIHHYNTDKVFYDELIKFITEEDTIIVDEYIAETEGIRIYNADYIEQYANTLDVMFDNEWTVIAEEEKYEEHEPVCPHVDTRPQQFIEWTIEYCDANENVRTFVFDNRQPLSAQIEQYVIQVIENYYKENFYDTYLSDVPLAPSSYVFCFFTRMSVDRQDEDNQERVKKSDEYLENLDTPEGTICLSRLTPANVFERCPIYLSMSVSLSGYSGEKQSFEENISQRIENMIKDMNEFTNSHLTAEISMGYHDIINLEEGKRKSFWAFIQGEQVSDKYGLYFERYVFDGYKGLFW